jgi:RND family efflux transporter MFP subunit
MNRIVLGRVLSAATIVALFGSVVMGCKAASAQRPAPPPTVTVSQPVQREVSRWDEYSGYLSSPETVIVNARVSGLILEAPFREGAIVHKGDLLFKLDPRPFQADLDNKKAAVAQAKALAERTKADFRRYSELLDASVVSQADFDSSKAAYGEAAGSLNAAQAALETSRLNLEWSEVKAPITGRISRMNVTVGNLVNGGSGQPTNLTTIVSIDPLYCYLNVPETASLHYQKIALRENKAEVAAAKIPCFMQLEGETNFPRRGAIDFVDNRADVNTGTVQIRCAIANPTMLLTPGLFTVTRLPASAPHRALLIPDVAVNTDQNERYLLLIGKKNIVERRAVQLGTLFGSLRSISGGLQLGEWVIVNGIQSAQPGAKVNPQKAPISAQALRALDTVAGGLPAIQVPPQTSTLALSDRQYPNKARR